MVAIDIEYSYYFFGRAFTEEGSGSGWIIDESGIIVNNYHVVEGADIISITLDDGRTFEVDPNTVVADPVNDLAVLKIDASNLTAAKVISQKGTCEAGHRVGDEFIIGQKTPPGICSWAFYTLFPFAEVLQFGGSFPWEKDPNKAIIA